MARVLLPWVRGPRQGFLLKLIKNFIFYSGANLLQKAIGFFLLPLYTHFLTTEDYGKVNIVTSITGLLTVFYMLSLEGAGTRFHYKYGPGGERVKEIWGTLLLFLTVNGFLLTALLLGGHRILLDPFANGIPFYPYLLLGLISVSLTPAYNLFQCFLQASQSGLHFGLNNLVFFLLNTGFAILTVVVLDMRATGVLLALAVTNGIYFAYSFLAFAPRLKMRFRWSHFKEAWAYSMPIIPHSLAGWAMSLMDRVFINFYKDASTVGLYSIGYQFASLINITTSSVNQAYVPWFFEKIREGAEGRARIAKLAELLSLAYSFTALAVTFVCQDVMSVFIGSSFREGWRVVPVLSFAFVFNGLYYFFVNVLFVSHTKLVPFVTFSSAILNFALNALLIPRFGMIGAACTSMATFICSSSLAYIMGSRVDRIGFRWARMYTYPFLLFAVSLIVFLKPRFPLSHFIVLKAAVLLTVAGVILFTHRKDAGMLKELVLKRLARFRPAQEIP